jgi:3-oxoacyl-[acyl-carrier-protein] synthase-3
MRYHHVCIESLGYTLPAEVVSSDDLERLLEPLYSRLRLPPGRLELMTGIRERRFWPRGTLPSEVSIVSGRRALDAAGIAPQKVGALVHGSVCRDHLEPATACRVHHELGLPQQCQIYDVSNACLGLLNGMLQVANMIELGQIEAGLVVGSEGSRQLVETTIAALNRDTTLTRQQIKLAVASLTIGSASCAILLTRDAISRTQNRLTTAVWRAHTEHHQLCHSGDDEAGAGMSPLMQTDSDTMMHAGIATGAQTFDEFLRAAQWSRADIHKSFCHQVGSGHRKLMLESLGLRSEHDHTTLEWLGNTGSAALPITLATGLDRGVVSAGDNLALLGIGSGINSVMLGVQWQTTRVQGGVWGEDEPLHHGAGQKLAGPHHINARTAPRD